MGYDTKKQQSGLCSGLLFIRGRRRVSFMSAQRMKEVSHDRSAERTLHFRAARQRLEIVQLINVKPFIPAGNEPSGRACTDSWRMLRGSNTPPLGALQA